MTLAGVEEFIVPLDLVDQTLEPLQEAGLEGFEAFVLWGGRLAGDERALVFESAYVPEQTTSRTKEGLLVVVEGDALFRVNRAFYQQGLILAGQVHSHPTAAYHSDTDDAYPLMTLAGGFSGVVPDFGEGGRERLDEWAWYRLVGAGDGPLSVPRRGSASDEPAALPEPCRRRHGACPRRPRPASGRGQARNDERHPDRRRARHARAWPRRVPMAANLLARLYPQISLIGPEDVVAAAEGEISARSTRPPESRHRMSTSIPPTDATLVYEGGDSVAVDESSGVRVASRGWNVFVGDIPDAAFPAAPRRHCSRPSSGSPTPLSLRLRG